MKTWAEKEDSEVTDEDVRLLGAIKIIFNLLPDDGWNLPKDEHVSCHIIARALAKHFPCRVVDGYFKKAYQHSWLLTPSECIIDPYPVGVVGGPILISKHFNSPLACLYRVGNAKDIDHGQLDQKWFQDAIDRASNIMVEILPKIVW